MPGRNTGSSLARMAKASGPTRSPPSSRNINRLAGAPSIGRSFTRAILARGEQANVELVAVNDPFGDAETMAFLLKHDSVGRTLANEVKHNDNGFFVVLETTFSADVAVDLGQWEKDLGLDTVGRWGYSEREKRGPFFTTVAGVLSELFRQASPDAIAVTWDGAPFGDGSGDFQ